jgi:uncharacterized membrane protein YccC
LRVALVLCVGVFIYRFFNIDHGYWIPLTIIIVIQPYYGATRKKGVERIVGTVAGIVLGGLIMMLPLPHEAFVVLLVVVSFFVAYFLRNNYKVGVFFVTIMMVILLQFSQNGSFELMGWRVLSTLIGSMLALIAGYIFWPTWEIQRFPVLIKNAMMQNKDYLVRVLKFYNKELAANENWYKNRRVAEEANNNAFACVQRMNEEPQNKQTHVEVCFAMIGITVRIAREINSLALLSEKKQSPEKIQALSDYYRHAEILFDSCVNFVLDKNPEKQKPDFKQIKSGLNAIAYQSNDDLHFIKTELEKIIFELETFSKLSFDYEK